MTDKEFLIVDVYCDGETLYLFRNADDIMDAIHDWEEQDLAYCKSGDESIWLPFYMFMKRRKYLALPFEMYGLGGG